MERAEGFWWAWRRASGRWEIVEIERRYGNMEWLQVRYFGADEPSDMAYANRHEIREWGHYLGTNPEECKAEHR